MKVVIVGGGILGLSLAFQLQRQPDLEIFLLEKKERFGGKVQTIEEGDFLFETGARCFSAANSNTLIELLEDLQLLDQIIACDTAQTTSYFYSGGKFHSLPNSFFSYSNSFLSKGWVPPFVHELLYPEKRLPNESIYHLPGIGLKLNKPYSVFDPLTSSFFNKDVRKLTFPPYLRGQTRGFKKLYDILNRKISIDPFLKKGFAKSSLFFLRDGMQSLVDALVGQLKVEKIKNTEVLEVDHKQKQISISTTDKTFVADHLFLTVPICKTLNLLRDFEEDMKPQKTHLVIVNLGYDSRVLSMNGFGYLVPASEEERALGVVFDSNISPQHNKHEKQTRITVIIGSSHSSEEESTSEKNYLKLAIQTLKKHLNIQNSPCYHRISYVTGVYPLEPRAFTSPSNQITFLGGILGEVSVNQCVDKAKHAARKFLREKNASNPLS